MYLARVTATFQGKLEAALAPRQTLIRDKMNMILLAPRMACKSERLRWQFAGKRSAHIDRRWRIIYAICEECYQQGDQGRNLMDCPECEQVPSETVNFLDILDYH